MKLTWQQLSVLSHRSFRNLFIGHLISQFGDAFTNIGLPMLVYEKTGSPALLTGMFLALTISNVFIGPIVGTLVDRWDRRAILIGSDIFRAAIVATVPFLPHLSLIYVAAVLLSLGGMFFGPARAAVIPKLIPESRLVDANLLAQTWGQVASLAMPAVAGTLIALSGLTAGFLIDSVSFMISALFVVMGVARLAREPRAVKAAPPKMTAEVKEAWQYLKNSGPLLWAMSVMSAFLFTSQPSYVLRVPFVIGTLHAQANALGFASTCWSIGALIAGLIGGFLNRRLGRVSAIITGLMIASVGSLNNSLSQYVPVFLIGSICVGIGNGISSPLVGTLYQEQTPNHLYGRVQGLIGSISTTLSLISMSVAGPLASFVGVRPVYVTAAGLAVLIAFTARLWPRYRVAAQSYATLDSRVSA